jgi:hypothetical protein
VSRARLLLLWGALALLAQVLPPLLPGAPAGADEPDVEVVAYDIDARLDAERHVVTGTARLEWRNTTAFPAEDVWLHLYLNAFRDDKSTFMKESKGKHRGHDFHPAHPGSIAVTSFVPEGGTDLVAKGEYVSCDDQNPDDRTVLRIPLDRPVAPGATGVFRVEWTSTLPKVFARTGFGGEFHMIAQWFPKPGVFEETEIGGERGAEWNCHQFHGSSEFYADYGRYDVRMTVPAAYRGRLGATGERVGEPRENEDGTITFRHRASRVHDFAWTCDTDYVVKEYVFAGGPGTSREERDRVARILGRAPEALDLPPVKVTLLLQPEHEDQAERHRVAVFHALTYMGFWFGPYPYPTLTVVDPDHRAGDAGGMEYPTLITAGTEYVAPERVWDPEFVIVHEFGHQHFYGLIGTNEFEHAWMDEGMNTYGTAKTLMKAYPPCPPVTRYAGFPLYRERPLEFAGWIDASRKAAPVVTALLDDELPLPFGSLAPVEGLAGALGVHHPPEEVSLWPSYEGVSAVAFLREAPLLTLFETASRTVKEDERTWLANVPVVDPIAGRSAWEYMNRRSYSINSYGRTADSLRTLEGLVGEETMVRIMREYGERWRWRHPTPQDFFRVAEEVAGREGKGPLDWFFRETFLSSEAMDFGIEDVTTFEDAGEKDGKKTPAVSIVTVRRHGGVRMPVDVRVRMKDGTERTFRWERDDRVVAADGGADPGVATPARGEQSRWVRIRVTAPSEVVAAEVDPLGRYSLDRDRTNDGLRTKSDRDATLALAIRLLGWTEMTTSFYGGL